MDRRNFIGCTAGGLLGAALSAKAARGMNVVFFLVDDLGWTDLSSTGSDFYQTPNIDALAEDSVRFTNAYAASPVCSPTRASIQTGKHPARLGITDWLGSYRSARLVPPAMPDGLPLEEVTIGEAMKRAGYRTFFAGKWHLGPAPLLPQNQGYDQNKGGFEKGHPPKGYFAPYHIPGLEGGPRGEYLTDRLTGEAESFLDGVGDDPFFLFLSHYAVHTPIQAKDDIKEKYKKKKIEEGRLPRFGFEGIHPARRSHSHAEYAATIESVDESMGRIVAKLDELGLSDNTAIIFYSDNGGLATSEGWPTSNLPLRAGKGWLYEGGIREPAFIHAPGIAKNRECPTPIVSHDLYPTALALAGLALMPDQHLDGVSLMPLLRGADSSGRSDIFWHYPHYSNQGGKPGGAIRRGNYKLIEWFEDWDVELYNLDDDPGEHDDLSKKLPDKRDELVGALRDWREEVGARMPARRW